MSAAIPAAELSCSAAGCADRAAANESVHVLHHLRSPAALAEFVRRVQLNVLHLRARRIRATHGYLTQLSSYLFYVRNFA